MNSNAKNSLDHGAEFPYDVSDSNQEKSKIPVAKDWAHAAARGILADLGDRRGIKQELRACDLDIRKEIVQSLAAIMRLALEESKK